MGHFLLWIMFFGGWSDIDGRDFFPPACPLFRRMQTMERVSLLLQTGGMQRCITVHTLYDLQKRRCKKDWESCIIAIAYQNLLGINLPMDQ